MAPFGDNTKSSKSNSLLPHYFSTSHEIPPQLLLPLNRLEQALEVPRAEPVEVIPLDDLDEYRRPVHEVLREEL